MNLDRMIKSLDRFSFTSRGEGSDEREAAFKETNLEDLEEESSEEPKITELKRKLQETQDQVNSYRDEATKAAELLGVYKNEMADVNNSVASQKAQLQAISEEKASLLKTIEELRLKIEETESKSTPSNEEKSTISDREIEATREAVSLKVELESSKEKQNSLEKVIDELYKKLQGKEDGIIVEEKDSLSRALDFTNKIVEDQRVQVSSGTVKLQHQQKNLGSKKELGRQKSIKQIEEELGSGEEHVYYMEKYIEGLEKKLEMYEAANKEKEIEEKKKAQIVNMQSTELREKTFHSAQLEQKIAELEHDLQLVITKHAEQELEGRKKLAIITLVLDALKNKYNLDPEHKEVIVVLEKDLANTSYAKEDGIAKKTREIVGEWRSKSFRYAKSRTRCMCSFINGKHSMSQKCAIGVGLFAIFLGVLLLGKRMLA